MCYQCVILCVCVCVSVLGVWTFLWFVCFCLLASQWSHTVDIRGIPQDAARAVVAFSFFSIATWVSDGCTISRPLLRTLNATFLMVT